MNHWRRRLNAATNYVSSLEFAKNEEVEDAVKSLTSCVDDNAFHLENARFVDRYPVIVAASNIDPIFRKQRESTASQRAEFHHFHFHSHSHYHCHCRYCCWSVFCLSDYAVSDCQTQSRCLYSFSAFVSVFVVVVNRAIDSFESESAHLQSSYSR